MKSFLLVFSWLFQRNLNIAVWSAVRLNNFKTPTLFLYGIFFSFFLFFFFFSWIPLEFWIWPPWEQRNWRPHVPSRRSVRRKRKQLTEALDFISLVFFFVFKYEMKHSTSRHWSYSNRNLALIFRSMTLTWLYQRCKREKKGNILFAHLIMMAESFIVT